MLCKDILTTEPVLHYYNPALVSVIQGDVSQHGLGPCLLQGKPVAYASRSLSSSECNYEQIEKKLIAIVFACVKFHQAFPPEFKATRNNFQKAFAPSVPRECYFAFRNMILLSVM